MIPNNFKKFQISLIVSINTKESSLNRIDSEGGIAGDKARLK